MVFNSLLRRSSRHVQEGHLVRPYHRLVKSTDRDTLYSLLGLPIERVILGIHVRSLLRDRRRVALFHSCTIKTDSKAPVSLGVTTGFPSKIRLPSTTNAIPVPEPGLSPSFKVVP